MARGSCTAYALAIPVIPLGEPNCIAFAPEDETTPPQSPPSRHLLHGPLRCRNLWTGICIGIHHRQASSNAEMSSSEQKELLCTIDQNSVRIHPTHFTPTLILCSLLSESRRCCPSGIAFSHCHQQPAGVRRILGHS